MESRGAVVSIFVSRFFIVMILLASLMSVTNPETFLCLPFVRITQSSLSSLVSKSSMGVFSEFSMADFPSVVVLACWEILSVRT